MNDTNKIKIMHLLNTGKFSGAENVAISIIDNMKKDFDFIYVSRDGSIRSILEEKSISFFLVREISIKNIRSIIKNYKPDMIHAHDYTSSAIAALTFTKIPIISHLHNNSPWIGRFGAKSIFFALLCTRYKKILTVSNSIMDEYKFGRFFRYNTNVIGNPIDITYIKQKAISKKTDKLYDIAFLGRLTSSKNPLVFIDIVRKVLEILPDTKVCMIGDGDLRKEVEEKILYLGLKGTITVYGFQKNPYSILNNTKILCMPSKWEGFGLGAIEALSLGKPVVCSGAGGLKEIVDNNCGKICGIVEEYVSEIDRLLEDKVYYQLKSDAALQKALNMDNTNSYYQELLKIYQNCIDLSNGGG